MKSWKNFFPLLRCPGCRRWLKVTGRSEYKLKLASPKEIGEAGLAGTKNGLDFVDSATSPTVLSNARTREGKEILDAMVDDLDHDAQDVDKGEG